jgi:hypothetical protein
LDPNSSYVLVPFPIVFISVVKFSYTPCPSWIIVFFLL